MKKLVLMVALAIATLFVSAKNTTSYVVAKGQTGYGIAEQLYGTGTVWEDSIVGNNPELKIRITWNKAHDYAWLWLQPGDVLKNMPDTTVNSASLAKIIVPAGNSKAGTTTDAVQKSEVTTSFFSSFLAPLIILCVVLFILGLVFLVLKERFGKTSDPVNAGARVNEEGLNRSNAEQVFRNTIAPSMGIENFDILQVSTGALNGEGVVQYGRRKNPSDANFFERAGYLLFGPLKTKRCTLVNERAFEFILRHHGEVGTETAYSLQGCANPIRRGERLVGFDFTRDRVDAIIPLTNVSPAQTQEVAVTTLNFEPQKVVEAVVTKMANLQGCDSMLGFKIESKNGDKIEINLTVTKSVVAPTNHVAIPQEVAAQN